MIKGASGKENMKFAILVILKFYLIFAVKADFAAGKERDEDICYQPESYGNCTTIFMMWMYEVMDHTCRQFEYSGCGGNANKFYTFDECYKTCINQDMKMATTSFSYINKLKYSTKSSIKLKPHVIFIKNDGGFNRENRRLKNNQKVIKCRSEVNGKNKKKSANVNKTNRTTKLNKKGKFKSGRKTKAKIEGRRRPVNNKKNTRKSIANTKDDKKMRYVKHRYIKFKMNETERKTKNGKTKRIYKYNCKQQTDRNGRKRDKNKMRKHCLSDKRKNIAMKDNSSTEKNSKRTGQRKLKRKNKNGKPSENPVTAEKMQFKKNVSSFRSKTEQEQSNNITNMFIYNKNPRTLSGNQSSSNISSYPTQQTLSSNQSSSIMSSTLRQQNQSGSSTSSTFSSIIRQNQTKIIPFGISTLQQTFPGTSVSPSTARNTTNKKSTTSSQFFVSSMLHSNTRPSSFIYNKNSQTRYGNQSSSNISSYPTQQTLSNNQSSSIMSSTLRQQNQSGSSTSSTFSSIIRQNQTKIIPFEISTLQQTFPGTSVSPSTARNTTNKKLSTSSQFFGSSMLHSNTRPSSFIYNKNPQTRYGNQSSSNISSYPTQQTLSSNQFSSIMSSTLRQQNQSSSSTSSTFSSIIRQNQARIIPFETSTQQQKFPGTSVSQSNARNTTNKKWSTSSQFFGSSMLHSITRPSSLTLFSTTKQNQLNTFLTIFTTMEQSQDQSSAIISTNKFFSTMNQNQSNTNTSPIFDSKKAVRQHFSRFLKQ